MFNVIENQKRVGFVLIHEGRFTSMKYVSSVPNFGIYVKRLL